MAGETPKDKMSPPIPLHIPFGLRNPLSTYLPRNEPCPVTETEIQNPSTDKIITSYTSPHLTLTYATSLDAHISLHPGTQTHLSGPNSKAMTHLLRTHHDAILIGVGTATSDDPGLNSRLCRSCLLRDENECPGNGQEGVKNQTLSTTVGLEYQPLPIILDPRGRWKCHVGSRVLCQARAGYGLPPLWVVDQEYEARVDGESRDALGAVGGTMLGIEGLAVYGRREEAGDEESRCHGSGAGLVGVNWQNLVQVLGLRNIRSIMVEGGGKVIRDLFKEENRAVVGSVIITMAPVWLGKGGVEAVPERMEGDIREVARLEDVKWIPMGEDVVLCGRFGRNPKAL